MRDGQVLPDSQAQWLPPAQMAEFYPIAALPKNAARAVSALQRGQVIAVPTDTLYGFAADASSTTGIQGLYSIKHRQAYAPLAICVADVADLHRYCYTDHLPEQLLQQLLPGPVTLILKRKEDAPLCADLNPGLETIGGFVSRKLGCVCLAACCLHLSGLARTNLESACGEDDSVEVILNAHHSKFALLLMSCLTNCDAGLPWEAEAISELHPLPAANISAAMDCGVVAVCP